MVLTGLPPGRGENRGRRPEAQVDSAATAGFAGLAWLPAGRHWLRVNNAKRVLYSLTPVGALYILQPIMD